MLHVAILDEELPFPLTSGKRIRTYNLLSRLAQRHRITYLCHRNPDAREAMQAERALTNLGIRTIVVDRRVPAKSGLGFYARLAGNLFSSLPYSVATHRSDELLAAATQLANERSARSVALRMDALCRISAPAAGDRPRGWSWRITWNR